MSSKPFYAPVLLNDKQFRGLRTEASTVVDWFKEWDAAVAEHNPERLIGLLHWGLQTAISRGPSHELSKMVCHYLAVADGHADRENFGFIPGTPSYAHNNKTPDELKRGIADKAWMELCNRMFTFSDSGEIVFWLNFAEPQVAKAFVNFIQPYRWKDDNGYRHCPNVDRSMNCAYHRKAQAFTKKFLQNAWNFKQIRLRYRNGKELEGKSWEDWKFFLSLRPQLLELMFYYNMLDFIYDQKLDSKSRKKLTHMAYSNSYMHHPELPANVPALQDVYGQCESEFGSLVFMNRTAARIVLVYPLLVAGRRQYVKKLTQKKLQAKVEETKKLEAKLTEVKAQLEALK
jgi:hypothetical protein